MEMRPLVLFCATGLAAVLCQSALALDPPPPITTPTISTPTVSTPTASTPTVTTAPLPVPVPTAPSVTTRAPPVPTPPPVAPITDMARQLRAVEEVPPPYPVPLHH